MVKLQSEFKLSGFSLKVSRISMKIDDNLLEAMRTSRFLTESRVIDHDLDQLGMMFLQSEFQLSSVSLKVSRTILKYDDTRLEAMMTASQ